MFRPSVTAALLAKTATATADERLLHAAVRADVSATRGLLDAGANPNGFRDRYGTTPLHAAVRSGSLRVCTALIEARADVNSADSVGGAPLSEAIRKVRPEVVRLLLGAGAKLDVRDRWGLPAEELLCGGSTTAAEREVRALILGAADALHADKADHLRRTNAALQARDAGRQMLQAATAAVEAARATGAGAEAQAGWEREVEIRRQARPHAWMADSGDAAFSSRPSSAIGGGAAAAEDVDRVRRERRAELLWLQQQQAVGYRLGGGANAGAPPGTVRATLSGAVEVSSHERAAAAKQAAWRATFNPLLGGARPDCERPANRARWNGKEQCWEEPLLLPRGGFLADPVLEGEGGRTGIESLSGFERLVLTEGQ